LITLVFFAIAFVYSSAGFGGGSMYLAVLSQVTTLPFFVIKLNGLINNLGVTIQSVWMKFSLLRDRKKEVTALIVWAALPCMIFGLIEFKVAIHQLLLGIFLTLGGISILGQKFWESWIVVIPGRLMRWISFFIGSIAGLTGIGGGIYFSPILYLSRWGKPKEIAAFTALFIAVNSFLSIVILATRSDLTWNEVHLDWLFAVVIGGWMGSKISISWLKQEQVKWITGILLIFAGQQLIWQR
jgi:uncharacterized membrane protein YfcA